MASPGHKELNPWMICGICTAYISKKNDNEILKVCFMLKMARIICMRYWHYKIHIAILITMKYFVLPLFKFNFLLCYIHHRYKITTMIFLWEYVIHHFISIITHPVQPQSECDTFAVCQYSDICTLWCLQIHWQVNCNDISNYMTNLLWGCG